VNKRFYFTVKLTPKRKEKEQKENKKGKPTLYRIVYNT
jgi:hypothetical protein